jgi:hypothetical protein
MNKMQQMRASAQSNVNTLNSAQHTGKGGGQGGPKVGAGEFETLLTKAEFAEGQNGGRRGMLTVKVIGGTPSEGTLTSILGGTFNIYFQTSNAEYLAQQNEDLAKILLQCGVSADKVFDDELETDVEILSHFVSLFNRLIAKNQEVKLAVRRKPQKAMAANGSPYYYNDILAVIGSTVTASDVPAPVPAPVEAEAVEATPVAPVAKAKPWAK